MDSLKHEWRKDNQSRVRAFIEEIGNQGRCIRLGALYEQLWDAEYELKDRYLRYAQSKQADRPYIDRALIASFIPDVEALAENLKRKIRSLLAEAEGRGNKDRITDDMIDRAREYPIESLIGNGKRGNVLCIAHGEKHPSMSIKNNRAKCFTCGYFGDSIDIYMKVKGAGFIEAVRALQ